MVSAGRRKATNGEIRVSPDRKAGSGSRKPTINFFGLQSSTSTWCGLDKVVSAETKRSSLHWDWVNIPAGWYGGRMDAPMTQLGRRSQGGVDGVITLQKFFRTRGTFVRKSLDKARKA